ncbi:MAG TPA: hypothetical protein VMF10_12145 [Candidatus Aquilonibacter sp.]|nr:hypothetical protein [Candidatus Aquilonibacter sp.]
MRKMLAICLFLVLCSVSGIGQTQPQWTVIWSLVLFDQTAPIPLTTAFTPTDNSVYRLSCSMYGTAQTDQSFQIEWHRIDGSYQFAGLGANGSWTTVLFMPKAGSPVSYYVVGKGIYSLGCTVEQLQNPN